MKYANFYPGPSRVYGAIPGYVREAYEEGILSVNHRSAEFMTLMAGTKRVLKEKMLIPEAYEVVFTSSATESWEIIAQSLTQKASQHFFNGAFGQKWAAYAGELVDTVRTQFGINEVLPTGEIAKEADVLCVTQNETSNATQVGMESLRMLRTENEGRLIAVDVTSSFGGIRLDFEQADVWYGSVQKCLGLPAGLGFMVLSPMAVHKAESIGESKHYNSLLRILENAARDQTTCTPNVLDIYLLYRTQQASKGMEAIENDLNERLNAYQELFEKTQGVSFLIDNEHVRSTTVLALKAADPSTLQRAARDQGIILGSGYGPWKPTTFRIANFPAIEAEEVARLMAFFAAYG